MLTVLCEALNVGWYPVDVVVTSGQYCHRAAPLPAEVRDQFRLELSEVHSLLIGWNYSPLIAHETLGDLMWRYRGIFVGNGVVDFHYLDDILLFGSDKALLREFTRGLCEFLQTQSLLISSKSQTEPSALVTWIGKTFDLARGTVRNTPGTIRKALAVVVRASTATQGASKGGGGQILSHARAPSQSRMHQCTLREPAV